MKISIITSLFLSLGLTISAMASDLNTNSKTTDNTAAKGFAVVELFTSEGCSSCPPADKLLAKIQEENAGKPVYISAKHPDRCHYRRQPSRFQTKQLSIAMKSIIVILISTALALAGCHDSRRLTPAPETIFDDQGLHVITSFHNNRTHTMSVLYGNDAALANARKERAGRTPGEATPGVATPGVATPGEVFKLVTWDLKQNPLWFGSSINGGLQSVETVTVSTGGPAPVVDYAIEHPHQKKDENAAVSNAERISFIFAQQASVFP